MSYVDTRERVREVCEQLDGIEARASALDDAIAEAESALGEAVADGRQARAEGERVASLAVERRGLAHALTVLRERLAEAESAHRQEIAAELRRQASAAEADHADRMARLNVLLAEVSELGGGAAVLDPDCPLAHLAQRPSRLRNAADCVQRGAPCPIDPASGSAYDRDLR